MSKCTIYETYCPDHDFHHGMEAEELRKGIENILEQNPSEDEWEYKLRDLLDRVDARDSLAYREAQQRLEAEEHEADGS